MSLNTTVPASAFVDGVVVPASQMNEIRTAFTGIQAARAAWTPTWTNATVGNGTVIARYRQVGKTIDYSLTFVLGSTSTISGSLAFTLPVQILTTGYVAGSSVVGSAFLLDSSVGTASRSGGTVFVVGTGANTVGIVADNSAPGTVAAAVPWTWAVGDSLSVTGVYEAA